MGISDRTAGPGRPDPGVSRDSIMVLWRRLCLQPHGTEGFKCSTGLQLEAEVRDVVGLYLAPPTTRWCA